MLIGLMANTTVLLSDRCTDGDTTSAASFQNKAGYGYLVRARLRLRLRLRLPEQGGPLQCR